MKKIRNVAFTLLPGQLLVISMRHGSRKMKVKIVVIANIHNLVLLENRVDRNIIDVGYLMKKKLMKIFIAVNGKKNKEIK